MSQNTRPNQHGREKNAERIEDKTGIELLIGQHAVKGGCNCASMEQWFYFRFSLVRYTHAKSGRVFVVNGNQE